MALFACLGNLPTGGWTDFQLHLLVQRDGVTLGLVLEVRHNSPPATCIPFLPPDPNHCLKRLQAECVLHQCQCIYDYVCGCGCGCVYVRAYICSMYISMYRCMCGSVYLCTYLSSTCASVFTVNFDPRPDTPHSPHTPHTPM